MEIRLTELIAPAFYRVHHDIWEERHTYYDLYGGRGSTKSTFVSLEIVLGIIRDPEANAVCFRKVGNTLRDSVYTQIGWAIDALGLEEEFVTNTNPMRFVYKKTGQQIIFRGLDKAKKTKSVKPRHGYFKYLWFEELDEYGGAEEIRTVEQSYARGRGGSMDDKTIIFKTFNPPISISNWANMYVQEPNERAYRHESNYLQVPEAWLGRTFIENAEHLKETNERAYTHEYLGIPVGIGTNIFDLLEIREITDEEVETFEFIYQGQDWGWYPDPKAFIRLAYNHKTEKVYALDELGGCKIRNKDMAAEIIAKGYDDYTISCGADEVESIVDFRDAGLPAVKTVQGNRHGIGSRRYTFEWLQCRTMVIDPRRTPRFYNEVINYEHELDKNGNMIADYPDGNDHWIDAARYAISALAVRAGNSA